MLPNDEPAFPVQSAALDELTAEVERMLHERRVRYYPSTLTPAASGEATSLPCADPGVAGTYSEDVA